MHVLVVGIEKQPDKAKVGRRNACRPEIGQGGRQHQNYNQQRKSSFFFGGDYDRFGRRMHKFDFTLSLTFAGPTA
jgi:hypothetical protein